MPYFVYKVSSAKGMELVKNLDYVKEFAQFKPAKNHARSLRQELSENSDDVFKIIFADSQLHAEELLSEQREKPILMEHEK